MSRRPMWYKLVDTIAVPCSQEEASHAWPGTRCVRSTDIGGLVWVSTIFILFDCGWMGDPLVFETAMFRCHDTTQQIRRDRCSTWIEAQLQHREFVDMAIAMLTGNELSAVFTKLEGLAP